jgi:Tol biopolymer transport system component
MALRPGTRLGDYEVYSLLASGGMGEVYRARDHRLGRDVAIKVLPGFFSSDPSRLRRFEQEARAAAALNHPNILAVFQMDTYEGAPYLVSELLDGMTLREHLRRGPLSTRKAIDYAAQIARGLAAAHDRGIVHRDLKPENLFVTKDGHIKILDFGLAKLTEPHPLDSTRTRDQNTEPGMVMGTVGYMAPEQVRGEGTDHRTDIFAFGAILYEMLSGWRAFLGATRADTISAILREDPALLDVSPFLQRIVAHCLEKSSDARFQSAKDVAFDLTALAEATSTASPQAAQAASDAKPLGLWMGLSAIALVLLVATAYWAGSLRSSHAPPVFHQLTFQEGFIESAVYAPGGDTVVFAASWEGGPSELYSLRIDSPTGVRPLGISASRVLSVSRKGEIALLQGLGDPYGSAATLAIAPLGAGAPRQILEDILSADWSPAKDDLAVSHRTGGRFRLEYPVAKVLRETSGFFDSVRFSPDGERIALVEHPVIGDSAGVVEVLDLFGHARVLTRKWLGLVSVAWAPSGREIWFTASDTPNQSALYAVSLNGKQRMLASVPGTTVIQSVLPSGRALIIDATVRHVLMVSTPDYPKERDFSWLDWPDNPVFSADGKSIAFTETSVATGGESTVFSRKLTGEPAVRLAEGWGGQISPDGKWVLAVRPTEHAQLWLHPLGAGQPRQLTRPPVEVGNGEWFPDSTGIAFTGHENGVWRTYLADLEGNVKPLTPPRAIGGPLTPDGKFLVTRYADRSVKLLPIDGGQPLPIRGVEGTDLPLRFSNDAKYLFVYTMESPVLLKIWKIDIASGTREFLKAVGPSDPAGVYVTLKLALGPDLGSYAYIYGRRLSSLYEVDGMR